MAYKISNARAICSHSHAYNLQTYNQENVEKFLSFCCSLHIMQLSQPQISNKQKYKIVFIHISMFHELDYMLLLAIDATREYRCSKIFLQYGLLQRYYQFYIDFNSLISHLLLINCSFPILVFLQTKFILFILFLYLNIDVVSRNIPKDIDIATRVALSLFLQKMMLLQLLRINVGNINLHFILFGRNNVSWVQHKLKSNRI